MLFWLKAHYVAAVGQFDLAAAFLELEQHASSVQRGRLGVVVPKRIATNESYAALRKSVAIEQPLVSPNQFGRCI